MCLRFGLKSYLLFRGHEHSWKDRCSNMFISGFQKLFRYLLFPFGFLKESAILAFELEQNKFWILQKAILSSASGEKGFITVQWCGHWSQNSRWIYCNSALVQHRCDLDFRIPIRQVNPICKVIYFRWYSETVRMRLYLNLIMPIVYPRIICWACVVYSLHFLLQNSFSYTHWLLGSFLHCYYIFICISLSYIFVRPPFLSVPVH